MGRAGPVDDVVRAVQVVGPVGDLHAVAEYLELRRRKRRGRSDLDKTSARRLQELSLALGSDADPGTRRRFVRYPVDLRGTLTTSDGQARPVIIADIGAGGLCVRPAPYLKLGQDAVVRVLEDGRDYQFPVRLKWLRRSKRSSSMGLKFVSG
jgi:hypothetical protein